MPDIVRYRFGPRAGRNEPEREPNLFFESDEVCNESYKDRDGKYQGQKGVTLPKT